MVRQTIIFGVDLPQEYNCSSLNSGHPWPLSINSPRLPIVTRQGGSVPNRPQVSTKPNDQPSEQTAGRHLLPRVTPATRQPRSHPARAGHTTRHQRWRTHYCLKALMQKGWAKMQNFANQEQVWLCLRSAPQRGLRESRSNQGIPPTQAGRARGAQQ